MKVRVLQLQDTYSFKEDTALLPYLSEERRKKILHLKRDSEKHISLWTELLLLYCIRTDLGYWPKQPVFSCSEYGKPYFIQEKQYHFSISHSGNWVAVASDRCPIGVDIEQKRRVNLNIAKRFFQKEEYCFLQSSTEPNRDFLGLWTRKEAYLKYKGVGLHQSLDSFSVLSENPTDPITFCTLEEENYIITVCYEKRV